MELSRDREWTFARAQLERDGRVRYRQNKPRMNADTRGSELYLLIPRVFAFIRGLLLLDEDALRFVRDGRVVDVHVDY